MDHNEWYSAIQGYTAVDVNIVNFKISRFSHNTISRIGIPYIIIIHYVLGRAIRMVGMEGGCEIPPSLRRNVSVRLYVVGTVSWWIQGLCFNRWQTSERVYDRYLFSFYLLIYFRTGPSPIRYFFGAALDLGNIQMSRRHVYFGVWMLRIDKWICYVHTSVTVFRKLKNAIILSFPLRPKSMRHSFNFTIYWK